MCITDRHDMTLVVKYNQPINQRSKDLFETRELFCRKNYFRQESLTIAQKLLSLIEKKTLLEKKENAFSAFHTICSIPLFLMVVKIPDCGMKG